MPAWLPATSGVDVRDAPHLHARGRLPRLVNRWVGRAGTPRATVHADSGPSVTARRPAWKPARSRRTTGGRGARSPVSRRRVRARVGGHAGGAGLPQVTEDVGHAVIRVALRDGTPSYPGSMGRPYWIHFAEGGGTCRSRGRRRAGPAADVVASASR